MVFVWDGLCDVITRMVFHWARSLNEDIKAVGCFYMHKGVMCGGHSFLRSSLMHNERIQKYTQGHNHTYEWAKYSCEGSLSSLNEEHSLFFHVTFRKKKVAKHSVVPRLSCFLCICSRSQAVLTLIFMTWVWHTYYYYHYCYYAFEGREVALGLAEVMQKQELHSLDWSDLGFMHTAHCLR